MARVIRTIAANFAIVVCFFYLGCGSSQAANTLGGKSEAPLTIATKLVPSAIVGTPYVAVLEATGGAPTYEWCIVSGKLPGGVALQAGTGVISGTPTQAGNFSIGVKVTDGSDPSESRTTAFTIAVAAAPLKIEPSTMPAAALGTPFSEQLQATGGTPGYTWSIASGTLPAGLKLTPTTGLISGTPAASGTTSLVASVRDSSRPNQVQTIAITLAVSAPPLRIAASALPPAVGGKAYNQYLQASGGKPGYRWEVASGRLPAGLTLSSSNGEIAGVPVAGGTSTFTASVSDSNTPAQTTSAPITIVVDATPLTIAASALPSDAVGAPYSQALQVSGGTPPYKWSLAAGALPSGLSLASSGSISGVPTASGTATFTASVADSSSPAQSTTITTSIAITPTPLVVAIPSLPSTITGSPYSQQFGVSGGSAPYTWSISSGKLPAGLGLSASGALAGTPAASGAFTFTATVRDSSSPAQSASASAAVLVLPVPLTITSSNLPSDTVATAYAQGLKVSGGSAPYTWSITSGQLPPGLSLTPSTGVISGTPTVAGLSTFTTTVMDSSSPAQAATATATISITPQPLAIASLTLSAASSGTAYLQKLQATGGTAPYGWTLTSGQLPPGLSLARATGVIAGTFTAGGVFSFTITVTDCSSPAQTSSATLTIASTAPPLSIVTSSLPPATVGASYAQPLQASGGTPGYTWSVTAGALPAGLTLAATTGTISGMPTTSGAASFTASVSDNSVPVQTRSVTTSIAVSAAQQPAKVVPGTTWYIRTDGGTRYSANVPDGQCDGKADVAYPGSGINQHCAFNDFRYLWDDDSGQVGSGAWVIAGGDTVILRGCTASSNQTNASNPNCRIGWDVNWGGGPTNLWCQAIGNQNCFNPPIPAGTPTAHTRILGQCVLAGNCNTGNMTNRANLSQIFGGMGLNYTLNLQSTQYVDIEGIEVTSHNGVCTMQGGANGPRACNRNAPVDDYASDGFILNNASSNITFQDVYVHGFNSAGFFGPIGGPITMTRVFSGFNAFAGWNFDDGFSTPDAPGSSITASYVTMIGNGCYEQYPLVNSFPASACYDDVSGGFGDAWSGQDTELDSFVCDHCVQAYNTKDAFIGPHTNVKTLTVTNSESYGNMGAQWKWNNSPNATTTFMNNLTVGNCARFSTVIPGAAHTFDLSSGLPGAYLSDYCRAAGNTVAINSQQNSYVLFANNTFVDYLDTVILLSCGPSTNNQDGMCASTPFVFTNNIFLGYALTGQEAPGLFYINDPSITVTQNNNIEFGNRTGTGETCNVNGNLCSDPLLIGEPVQQAWATQTFLDNFDFFPNRNSPAIGAGAVYAGILPVDYYGVTRPTPPTIGAVEPQP